MKAFQYLAALSLGAVVALSDAALPAVAQTESAEASSDGAASDSAISDEASAQVVASAIALIPKAPSLPQLDLAPAQFTAKATPAIAQATEEAIEPPIVAPPTTEPEVPGVEAPGVEVPADADEVVQPAVPRPGTPNPESPIPVDSGNIDPVEAEFDQEGSSSPPNPTPPETGDAVPEDGLSEASEETDGSVNGSADEPSATQGDMSGGNISGGMSGNGGVVVDSSAPATTLIDEQPNLFRPDETSEVLIEVNEPITLEAAIEIARQNNPTIRISQLQLEQSRAAVDEARAAYAPQFSVNGSFDNTGTLTKTNELYREPDLGQIGDSNARDALVSLSGNARIDYGIIDPDRKAAVDAAKIAAKQAQLALEIELADLRLTVSESYYQLQEADEQVKISEQAVITAQRSLKDAQALERAGVGTRFSVLQADVQLSIEQQNLVNSLSDQQTSRRLLAQVLSTPEKLNLTAADPVTSAGAWTMTLEQSIIQSYANRVELDTQLLQRDLSEAQRRVVLATTRPSLSVFAQAGPGVSWNFNRTNPDDGDDFTSGIQQGTLGYQTGLSFQWLFGDGGATKAAARQQALGKAIAEENFEAVRNQIRGEVEDAFYDIAANLRNIDTAEKSVVQAEEALRLGRLRFQAGVGTQTEVVDAERDLTTARGNRVSAILNYNRALVAIQRAIGEALPPPALEIPAAVDGGD